MSPLARRTANIPHITGERQMRRQLGYGTKMGEEKKPKQEGNGMLWKINEGMKRRKSDRRQKQANLVTNSIVLI